ncbi:unnamed protein product [Dovyalis caffra]|uniref:Uncharacterized protein n=1 Tax=Dovyalis caffra TaxID=77055 RepID=A0AAV1SRH1_9ROSI|nr:unnamed protein product [Dovyalis caffra]
MESNQSAYAIESTPKSGKTSNPNLSVDRIKVFHQLLNQTKTKGPQQGQELDLEPSLLGEKTNEDSTMMDDLDVHITLWKG